MVRESLTVIALMALAGCVSAPNDVAEGVGFQDYQDYQARRAALRGEAPIAPQPATILPPTDRTPSSVVTASLPATPVPTPAAQPAADPIAAVAAAAISEAEAAPVAQAPAPTTPTNVALASAPAPQTGNNNPDISDEQNFDAVAARETIESDAERLARMQAARVEVAPTAIPNRPGGGGPNIVNYALATSHSVGERLYSRNPIGRGRHEANCLAFRSPDLAQEWFLANGGPTRDRRALDPDGDGYACAWNPELYRAAARAAQN